MAMAQLGLGLPRSAPGYFTVLFSAVVLGMQTMALYDPTDAMKQIGVSDAGTCRAISFMLIAINSYDLIGALKDDWAIYWLSFVSRIGASAVFWYAGGAWADLVPIELGSAVVLGACMAWAGSRKK